MRDKTIWIRHRFLLLSGHLSELESLLKLRMTDSCEYRVKRKDFSLPLKKAFRL